MLGGAALTRLFAGIRLTLIVMANRITFYDFAYLYWSSFYLTGFFQNQSRHNYRLSISRDLSEKLRSAVMDPEWHHLVPYMCVFRWSFSGKEITFCIDTHDLNKADPVNRVGGYHLPLLEQVDYYFKVNFNRQMIEADPYLKTRSDKIFPANQFISIRTPFLLPLLPRLIPSLAAKWSRADARTRFRDIKNHMSVKEIMSFRDTSKEFDVFCVISYRGGHQHRCALTERFEVLQELSKRRHINALAGFASDKDIPSEYARYQVKRYSYRQYVNSLARARVVIYVRGLHDCLSQKFPLYLALGIPVVGHRLTNNSSELYRDAHLHEQFAFNDPKEIVDNVERLLATPDKLRRLSKLNTTIFDRDFTPSSTTSQILEQIQATSGTRCG